MRRLTLVECGKLGVASVAAMRSAVANQGRICRGAFIPTIGRDRLMGLLDSPLSAVGHVGEGRSSLLHCAASTYLHDTGTGGSVIGRVCPIFGHSLWGESAQLRTVAVVWSTAGGKTVPLEPACPVCYVEP
jgi:hypothetical protein